MVTYFLWREANWSWHWASSSINQSSPNRARGHPGVLPSAGVTVVLGKGRALSAENNVFQTQTCPFSHLLEAPKFDMRKAYECRIGAVLAGKRALEERGLKAKQYRARRDIYTRISLPV